jgi:hypothetical protein
MTDVVLKDAPGFVKDSETGAVINTSLDGYELILAKRQYDANMRDIQAKIEKQERMLEKLTEALGK